MEQMTMPWGATDRPGLLLRELPAGERPADRMQKRGAGALSVSELLTTIMQAHDAALAHQLLARFGLQGLLRAHAAELCAVSGVGPARAGQIKAALELGRRLMTATVEDRPQIKSPADAANLLIPEMGLLEQEQLRVLLLDSRNRLLATHTVYVGNLNTMVLRTAEVFREAIRANAAGIIVAHNHPSAQVDPSPQDIEATEHLVQAGRLLSIDLLDHLIIGRQRFLSLKERGLGFSPS